MPFGWVYQVLPLARAKVSVIAPDARTQERASDAGGRAAIDAPRRGRYVLEVTHTDDTPGEFDGARFDASRHRAVLGFVQPFGEDARQARVLRSPGPFASLHGGARRSPRAA